MEPGKSGETLGLGVSRCSYNFIATLLIALHY